MGFFKNSTKYEQRTTTVPIGAWSKEKKRFEKLIYDVDETKVAKYAVRLVLLAVFLIAVGLIVLYSASFGVSGAKYFQNQLMWAFVGAMGGIFCYYIGYKELARFSPLLVIGVVILLIFAFFGPEINGANRWIRIRLPGITLSLQPSELTKIVLTLYLANYCAKYYRTLPLLFNKNGMITPCCVTAIVLIAILMGRDLGTTVLVGVTAVAIFFAAGVKGRYFVVPLILGVLGIIYILLFDEMRKGRFLSFLYPEQLQTKTGYQLWMSKLALGSGSWLGQGFMCSRMKARYLPEAHTDFILSVLGEEFGYIGMLIIILAYTYFTYLAFKISINSRTKLGMFIGFGITTFISLQTLINFLVIAGLMPTKGMPAPFISYGGSNLLSCLISIGILLSIASDSIDESYNYNFYKRLKSIKGIFTKKHD